MTSCNVELEQDLGWSAVGVVDKVNHLFEAYQQDVRDFHGSRVGGSLFVPYIREVGFKEIFCHDVRVVTIMSWPRIVIKDVESDGYFPKCILDNEGNVVSFYEPGSSHEWRLRFLDRVNQFRKQGLSVLLLNNWLCENVHWSLNELKLLGDKSALKTKTTQGILDTLGRKDWKVQCWDTLFEYNGESDSNGEPDVITLMDSLRANKADPLYNQLFSEGTMEICGTFIPIKEPNATGNTTKWDVGIQFLSKELNGGRTPMPEYIEATTVNGVGNNILKLWMISLGVIGLQLFIFL